MRAGTMRTMAAAVMLLAMVAGGCGLEAMRQEAALWQTRERSFYDGDLHTGMTLAEVLDLWGPADEVQQSVVGETHFGTLIYRRHIDDHGVRFDWAFVTYHLSFVDGNLHGIHRYE